MFRNRNQRLRSTRPQNDFPPQFANQNVKTIKRRYFTTSAITDGQIYVENLYAVPGMASSGTAALTAVGLAETLRVRSIEIWGVNSAAATSFQQVMFTPGNAIAVQPNNRPHEIVAFGNSSKPAHIRFVPHPNSLLGDWMTPGNYPYTQGQVMWNWTMPAGSVVDIEIQFIIADGTGHLAGTVAATTNSVTVPSLDFADGALGAGSAYLVPSSTTTRNPSAYTFS